VDAAAAGECLKVDGATLQAKVWSGQGKAAQRIGLPFDVYRPGNVLPTDTTNPLAPYNKVTTLPANFTANGGYTKPNTYGQATWQGMLDGTKVKVGDYLDGTPGTFFIAALQPLLPILAVGCNRIVSLTQGGSNPIAVGWPASILVESPRGNEPIEDIAGNPATPHWWMLLPAVRGMTFDVADLVTDDLFRNYFITSAEQTDLGWRISMMQTTLLTNSVILHYQTVIDLVGKPITYRRVNTLGGANPAHNPVTGPISVTATTTAGSTAITLTAPSGNWFLAAGDKFTIAGSPTVYTVTAQNVASGGHFNAVQISPALSVDAVSGALLTVTWANDYPIKGLIGGYDATLFDGSTIQVSDLQVKIPPTATDGRLIPNPTTLDAIIIDGHSRTVITIKPEYAGSVIAVYSIQAR